MSSLTVWLIIGTMFGYASVGLYICSLLDRRASKQAEVAADAATDEAG